MLQSLHCKRALAGLLIAATLVGCSERSTESEAGKAPGELAYNRACAGCHGVQGQGRAPNFPPLDGSEWLALPTEGLTALVLLGLRGEIEVAGQRYVGYMPPMQHLGDARIAEIVGYIQRRWSTGGVDWTAEDVARIRAALAGERSPRGREGLNQLMEKLP